MIARPDDLSTHAPHPRQGIYYWKCDRPAAFHGIARTLRTPALEVPLRRALETSFPDAHIVLRPGVGQGNHVTYVAEIDSVPTFVRIEDGPERDDYMLVESHLLEAVRALGVPTPKILAVDASRSRAPFAWQVMELIEAPDLNQQYKEGQLDLAAAAGAIGAAVARWQSLPVTGFGPFDPAALRDDQQLAGFHTTYTDYFRLQLRRHLIFLVDAGFLPVREADEMTREIDHHASLLDLPQGCLVHKDLALWNILGSDDGIAAFIDWDDAVAGDPMDDLSLLGCFYDGSILRAALEGYGTIRPLPTDYRRRFWLHLLRNMIVKAVIRVGAGYFDRDDGFFLIGTGSGGADLKTFTRARLAAALRGLRKDSAIHDL